MASDTIAKKILNLHPRQVKQLSLIFLSFLLLMLGACTAHDESSIKVLDKQAEQYFIIADSLFEANNYERAIEQYRQALKIYEQKKDTTSMSDCYFQLSSAYHRIGDFNLSIDMAKKHPDVEFYFYKW